jgi:hypothetical protein
LIPEHLSAGFRGENQFPQTAAAESYWLLY